MGKKKGTRTLRFKYNEDTMGNHKIFIWVWSAVLVVSYLVCSSFWGYNAPSIPFSFLFVYIVYLWCRRWESKNEEAERTRALELMKERVVDDVQMLYGEDVTISSVGYCFYRDEKDERHQCILVYLSNKKTVKYDVKHIPSEEDDVCCCEIDLKPIETEDRKLVRKISPHFRPLLYLSPRNEFKVRILIIYAIGFSVIAVGFIAMNHFKWIAPVSLLGYLVATGILGYTFQKMKWLRLSDFFVRRFNNVLRIIHFSVPAFDLALVLAISLCIGLGIPAGIIYGVEQYTGVVLSKSVQYFICIVLSAIILVHHDNMVHNYILSLLLKHDLKERIKKYPFVEVALNLTQGRNINFLIYLSYFVFFTWITLARLQGFDPFFSQDFIDGATPAFLIHIAYTNMIIRLKDVDLKMDTMMMFMSKAYDIRILQLDMEGVKR